MSYESITFFRTVDDTIGALGVAKHIRDADLGAQEAAFSIGHFV
jgi:hypothetical protein